MPNSILNDNVSTVKVRTKVNKDATESTVTELTLEWDITQEQIIELAQRAVVIQQQAIYRTSGKIPAKDHQKVSEIIAKQPRTANNTPEAIAAKAAKDPEFMAELKKQLGLK